MLRSRGALRLALIPQRPSVHPLLYIRVGNRSPKSFEYCKNAYWEKEVEDPYGKLLGDC